MKRFCFLLFSVMLLFTAQYTWAGTEVSGIITTNTTWTIANSPYIVTGNVLVNEGVRLNIEAGVTVKFDAENVIQVNGELIARGTNTNQITFTSNQGTPAAGDWGWILFADTSTDASYYADGNYTDGSVLEYCVIEYGGGGDSVFSDNSQGTICVDNSYPFINHCVVQNNSASGIKVYNHPSEGETKIYNSTFRNNDTEDEGGGISIHYSNFEIKNTVVSNNTSYTFGGGIDIYKYAGTISGCTITGNESTAGFAGGGIRIASSHVGNINIVNNTIGDNIAGDGGGICFSGNGTIRNNHIYNNTANSSGAGRGGGGILISVEDDQVSVLTNVIEGNEAENGSAIKAWAMGSAKVEVKYNQIINHSAASSAIYVENHVWDYDKPESSFNYNNIYNNTTTYELFNNSDSTESQINAQYNYWGTTSEIEVQAKIYDFLDDGSKSVVQYQPIATEPYLLSDNDNDGIPNYFDNCINSYNPDQSDIDGDGVGNACDNCPADPNKTEPGVCGCGVADTDTDGDGTPDCNDNCPSTPNPDQADSDGDGIGNACDADADGDGIPDANEANVPNANGDGIGDGNGDGISDRLQASVTSLMTVTGNHWVTITNTAGGAQNFVNVIPVPGDVPADIQFPYGFIEFTLTCSPCSAGSVEPVEMMLYFPYDININGYWKKDNMGIWQNIAKEIGHIGTFKTRVTIILEDNGIFDENPADCVITDGSGPGYKVASLNDIPTLSGWGVIIFALLIACMSIWQIRRMGQGRKPAKQE